MSAKIKPLIGLPTCVRESDGHPTHVVYQKYIEAVIDAAGGLPVLLPSIGDRMDWPQLLSRLDGVLLTGSPSNIEPHLYGKSQNIVGDFNDPQRDASTLPFIKLTIDSAVPILGICRGFQEMNVVLGGTLHQEVHKVAGRFDHRRDGTKSFPDQHLPSHPVTLTANGWFHQLVGRETVMVNSLHGQGIDQPAPNIQIEALADDGTIEAFSVPKAPNFAVAVQWHPEWKPLETDHYRLLFAAFGEACRTRAGSRTTL